MQVPLPNGICHINELEAPLSSLFPEFGARQQARFSVSRPQAARDRPLHHITTPLRDNAVSDFQGTGL
jgi:hypothetical protein